MTDCGINIMSDWKKIVGTVAPTLATALGGPLAGTATKMLLDKFSINASENAESELEAKILGATPEDLAKIKAVESNFKLEMKRLNISHEQLFIADVQDSRSMAEQVGVWPQIVIAAIFLLGYFCLLGYLVYAAVEKGLESLPQAILVLVSIMTAAVPQILGFFYGTTKGSSDKNNSMFKLSTLLKPK